ncbi:RNA-guided endonuclease InsQ/TnpB family protein [Streptomyces canus]|uniref:RNA-guided endonuclease InsQ/TnpB family protein n=1 Tax=Streptomyces canus TaxID=58343 RepID=UPI00224E2CA4|nr:transposase [Streptomyces canus]MCX4860020.1 transposase [Streptomyces canus]
MKLVVQVKLLPTPVQAAALETTLRACNEAASWVAEVAFESSVYKNFTLRKHCYAELKSRWGLGAQAAQHVIKKTADAYTALHANLNTHSPGKRNSKRKRRDAKRPLAFRPESAQPYDDRMLSWQTEARTVSVWTTRGRIKDVAYVCGPEQLATLSRYRRGESDLVHRDNAWFLLATCEVPEAALKDGPVDFLGVDLGIVNIATTSDGEIMSGRRLNRSRARDGALRRKLQKKGTKSAKRRAQRRRRKEARRTRDINHKIAKHVVAEAGGTSHALRQWGSTGRGIALEDLTGIRERVRLRKPQRATLHSWAFAQLGGFIAYKARRAGVPVVHVDPAYTSRTCAECGHVDKANRVSQAWFACRSCGFVDHADRNSSRNIRARAWELWRSGARSVAPAGPGRGRLNAGEASPPVVPATQALPRKRRAADLSACYRPTEAVSV